MGSSYCMTMSENIVTSRATTTTDRTAIERWEGEGGRALAQEAGPLSARAGDADRSDRAGRTTRASDARARAT
jgi:hypothetical protein